MSRICLHFIVVWLFLSAGQCALAQSVTIDEAVRKALRHHPQLAVAKSNIAIAQARLIDAGKLENPVLEFGLTSQISDGPNREGSLFVGYNQVFPITSKLLRQRQLGKADVLVACAEVNEVERNFIDQVQEAYILALGAKVLISEAGKIEAAAQNAIDQAQKQVAAALGSELDVASAETEKALASQDRVLAENSYRKALSSLRQLIGVNTHQQLILTDSLASVISRLTTTTTPFLNATHLKRADLVVAEVRKQRALADHQLAQSETLEDWEFSAGYEGARSVDVPIGVERERFISMGVKVPIPVRKQGEGRVAETRARSEKVDHEIALVKATQQSDIAAALADAQTAKAVSSNLINNVLPQLKSRESKTWQAYQEGLANFNQIIMLKQQKSRTQRAYTKARLDEALALSRLQHALGSHPALKVYDPCQCQFYQPGTEPIEAPWVLGETKVVQSIQALPVLPAKSRGLKNLGNKLFGNKHRQIK